MCKFLETKLFLMKFWLPKNLLVTKITYCKYFFNNLKIFIGYKIIPAEVRKRPTLPGLFRLPTLCSVFLNFPDRSSFHNTIRTSLIMSCSIHLPDYSKRFLCFAISWFSTVIDYSLNLFQTSSGHGRLYSKLLLDFVSVRASPTAGFLQ